MVTVTALQKAKIVSIPSGAGDVRAKLVYATQPAGGAKPYFVSGVSEANTNVKHEEYDAVVRDIRSCPEGCTLAEHGFTLTSLSAPEKEDLEWTEEEQVKRRFYPVAEQVIKGATGATRVHIFDHTVRNGVAKHDDEQLRNPKVMADPKKRPPIPRVHTDFSESSGPQRLQAVLPDEAEKLKQSRYAIIQLWRPLVGPVTQSPLALIDVQSIAHEDMMQLRIEIPASDARSCVLGTSGYIYTPTFNKEHHAYYASAMTTSEALLFKGFDTRPDLPRFVPHASFRHPDTPDDAPPRESIELRAFAFWDDE